MSEADWWVCSSCKSLNNLPARKCYSCGTGKRKLAQRLSDLTGDRAVVEWNGRVRYEHVPRSLPAEGEVPVDRPEPLREPPARNILEIAPPLPNGASITYRSTPARSRPDTLPTAGKFTVATAVEMGPGGQSPMTPQPSAVRRPPDQSRPLGRSRPSFLNRHEERTEPPVPDLKLGDPRSLLVQHVGPWPHWNEILDVPNLDARQLRGSGAAARSDQSEGAASGRPRRLALHSALKNARRNTADGERPERFERFGLDEATIQRTD